MVSYFRLICDKIKMLPWLRAVTFGKLQLSISLQLTQHFSILWERGKYLMWTTEQTKTERICIKIWKQCTQLYEITKIIEETWYTCGGPNFRFHCIVWIKRKNRSSKLPNKAKLNNKAASMVSGKLSSMMCLNLEKASNFNRSFTCC